jgi:hypothetical protein
VAHSCNPATQEVEIRKIIAGGQPGWKKELVKPHHNKYVGYSGACLSFQLPRRI